MSMIGNFLQITPRQLSEALITPLSAEELVYPESGDDPEPPDALDINQYWHVIHFLLTADPWRGDPPLSLAVLGGTELKGTDGGYGPIRYLTPEQVADVAQALHGITPDLLWARFNAETVRQAKIHPGNWENTISDQESISRMYSELQEFYANARERGNAVLQYIS